MKKLFILTALMAAMFSVSAQSADDLYISGSVLDANSGAPITNHMVFVISDSMNTVIVNDTTYTDNSGDYSFQIVGGSVIGPNQVFHVITYCNNSTVYDSVVSNQQGTLNVEYITFNICGTNPGGGCQPTITYAPDSNSTYGIEFFGGVSFFTLGNVISWSWSFGDGTGSNIQNPVHTFSTPGLHYVCLTIATDSGCTSVFCDSVYVGPNNGGCQTNFTFQASGFTLGFTGYTSSNYPTTWTWDLGDGTIIGPGSSNAVTHTYSTSGYYTVCLTATDTTGCTDTWCQAIYVASNVFNSLCGTVSAGGAMLDHGMATLFTIDTTSGSVTWYQSVVLDSSSNYCFLNIPNGTYIVLAEPDSISSVFNQYFPTYYGDVLNWANATVILVPGNPAPGWDINLIGFNNPSPGGGGIGGGLFFGGNKGVGDPVPGVEVILYDATLDALISTVSDDNGQFSFSDLAYGTYTVYPEIPGMNTIPAVVVLSSSSPTTGNLYFTVNSNEIVAGIEQPVALMAEVSDVYPNPVNSASAIHLTMQDPAKVKMCIYDITGRLLSEKQMHLTAGSHLIRIDNAGLASGSYRIILSDTEGNRIIRSFVK